MTGEPPCPNPDCIDGIDTGSPCHVCNQVGEDRRDPDFADMRVKIDKRLRDIRAKYLADTEALADEIADLKRENKRMREKLHLAARAIERGIQHSPPVVDEPETDQSTANVAGGDVH